MQTTYDWIKSALESPKGIFSLVAIVGSSYYLVKYWLKKPREGKRHEIKKINPVVVIKDNCTRFPEMNWLTSNINATPEGNLSDPDASSKSLSQILFNSNHVEFERTAVGILCIYWVLHGDYESFTECQAPDVKLSRSSFNRLKQLTEEIISNFEDDLLIVFTVMNDLGKVKAVIDMVQDKTKTEEIDHDAILYLALKNFPQYFPSFQKLQPRSQEILLEVLATRFNFAQFVQGENLAANLKGLAALDRKAFRLFILHSIFDMAGAAGQVKRNGSLVLAENLFRDMENALNCLEQLSEGKSVSYAYESYLRLRGKDLGLDASVPTERALIRLACMMRLHFREEASLLLQAVSKLGQRWATLEEELNRTGVDGQRAILLYYMPALLVNATSAVKKEAQDLQLAALVAALGAVIKMFAVCREHLASVTGEGVFTADIAEVAAKAKTPLELEKVELVLTLVGNDGKFSCR